MNRSLGVLIVGAGPAGLMVANSLVYAGYQNFRVIEARRDFGEGGRAVNLWARTQEIVHAVGARDLIAQRSLLARGSHMNAYGDYVGFQRFDGCASRFPEVLTLVQSSIQRGLGESLARSGIMIEFGSRLIGVEQDGDGVTVQLIDDDGNHEEVRCRYLVAGDGGRSATRELVGMHLVEHDIVDARIHQMDGRLIWSQPRDESAWHLFIRDNGQAGVVPLPSGVTRVFVCESLDTALPDRNPTPEEMTERMRMISGDESLVIESPVWASHGRLSAGLAPGLRTGNVFLVGDAGHKVLPVGGQGANQALHDGFNLGWKLGHVLEWGAPARLLDTYHDERYSIRTQFAIEQASSFQRMIQPSPEQIERTKQMARDFASQSSRATDLPQRDLQMLDVNYPDSDLSEDHLVHAAAAAGDRAPDARVVDLGVERATCWLSDIIYHGRWTLLSFDAGEEQDVGRELLFRLREVARQHRQMPYRLCAATVSATTWAKTGTPVLLDVHRELHKAFEVSAPAIYAIRPDGQIGFRGSASHWAELDTYLARVLGGTIAETIPQRRLHVG